MHEIDGSMISRRDFLHYLGAGVLAAALPGLAIGKGSGGRKRPNVLFISVDDLRPQLGCYGHKETISPNIDRLASGGTLFERAYCNVPVCMASRVGVFTGVRPAPGVDFCADLRQDYITLPALFSKNGYYCLSNGKVLHNMLDRQEDWSESPWRSEEIYHGKDDWAGYNNYKLWQEEDSAKYLNERTKRGPYFEAADVPDNAYQDGKVADKTVADLKRLVGKDQPFFLACGFWRPHLPFNAPKKYWDMYDSQKIAIADNRYTPKGLPGKCKSSGEIAGYGRTQDRLADEDFHREARHAYYACVSYVDAQVGRVLAELDRLGLVENTVVVLWGDHGWNLGEHNFWGKHNTLDNSLHAPLIIRAPGHLQKNSTSSLVEFADIYPTVCALAGIPIPKHVEGMSLVPLMDDPKQVLKKAVYSRWGDGKAVKTDRYLYTEWSSGERMLFDHETDPEENTNIADDPKVAAVVAEHRRLLN